MDGLEDMKELADRIEELAKKKEADGKGDADAEPRSLNWLMEQLPVSLLSPSHLGTVLDVRSDASLDEAIRLLASNGILSAPVRDVSAPEDASWIDRYIGVVDFPAIVLWVLNHSSVQALKTPHPKARQGKWAFGKDAEKEEGAEDEEDKEEGGARPEVDGRVNGTALDISPGDSQEDLFSLLESSSELRSFKVLDISGSFRWAPFLPLTREDSLLTLLLMISTYRARVVPIVEPGQGPLANIITQTSITRLLCCCMSVPSFTAWSTRPISTLGLPAVSRERMVTVNDSDPVLEPFRLMLRKGIGGVPVLRSGTNQVVGSISVRDIQVLLLHPRVLQQRRMLVVHEFMELAKKAVPESQTTAVQKAALTISTAVSLGDLLKHMAFAHSPRAYVTDDKGDLLGVVTLRDVISRLVVEPPGYFGDFFQGVVPAALPIS